MTADVVALPPPKTTKTHEQVTRAIAAEVRAEMARQNVSETLVAEVVFGKNQQWLSRRCLGNVAFSAAELLLLASYLGVSVMQFYLSVPPDNDGVRARQDSNLQPSDPQTRPLSVVRMVA